MGKARLNCLLLTAFLSAATVTPYGAENADDPKYAEYVKKIEDLNKIAYDLVKTEGKDAVAARYRALIDAHPGYEENVHFELIIANVYMYCSFDGEFLPDSRKTFEHLDSVIARYDKSAPRMRRVKHLAAQLGRDIDHVKSERFYMDLMEEYPDDDHLRLNCLWGLGLNAKNQGDLARAEEFYSLVLMYEPVDLKPSMSLTMIRTEQKNAALGLVGVAAAPSDPVMKLASIKAMLKKYPDIITYQSDFVDLVVKQVEGDLEKQIFDAAGIAPYEMRVADEGAKPREAPKAATTPGKSVAQEEAEAARATTQTAVVHSAGKAPSSESPGGSRWLLISLLGLAGIAVIWMVVLYVRQ